MTTPLTAYFVIDATGDIASRACWSQRRVREERTRLAREQPGKGPYKCVAFDIRTKERKATGEVRAVITLARR